MNEVQQNQSISQLIISCQKVPNLCWDGCFINMTSIELMFEIIRAILKLLTFKTTPKNVS